MSTKDNVLALLERSRGTPLSGEEIAAALGVSRAAVWKAVKSLEQDGHAITAATNRGYSLLDGSGVLSVQGMTPYLADAGHAENIRVYPSLESTNNTAKELAVTGCAHGTVVVADNQTGGRGRYGRSFYSPPGGGLYMSFVLRPSLLDISAPTLVTSAAAVAVCRAVRDLTGREPEIKWVNDVLLDGRKVCGILTEAVTDIESGAIDWLVVGIGINVNTTAFPDELSGIAASVSPDSEDGTVRNRLAAMLVNAFLSPEAWMADAATYREYKSRLTMLGKPVTVHSANESYEATALDVDDLCRLIVLKADGTVVTLSSGEVSVRQIR